MNRRMMISLIPLVIFAALLLLFWVGLGLNPQVIPSPLIGKEAPKFELPELHDPQKVVNNEMLKGQVTLFNVFASWCVSCRAEHHHLLKLQRQGFRLIGLNYKDEKRDALLYLRQLGGDPYEMIAYDHKGEIGIEWGVYGTPETFVVDKKGIVRYKHTGPLYREVIENELIPLIRELEQES